MKCLVFCMKTAEKRRIYDNAADSGQDSNAGYEYASPFNNPQTYEHTTRHGFYAQDPLFASFQVNHNSCRRFVETSNSFMMIVSISRRYL